MSISAGDGFSIALKDDGSAWAWGDNDHGTLGNGHRLSLSHPVRMDSADDWSAISGGDVHGLGIKEDGTLWGWGGNVASQIGDGHSTERLSPVQVWPVVSLYPFSDIASSPYLDAIGLIAGAGIVSGYGDGTFGPERSVLRAQFAKMVTGALGYVVAEDMTSPFTDLGPDIPTDLYPHEYVAASWAKGVTNGTSATTFAPYVSITRAQVVTTAVRGTLGLFSGALSPPPSGATATWGDFDPIHGENALIAEYNGLLDGLPLGELNPWEPMPRGEVAQVLANVYAYRMEYALGGAL